MNVDLQLLGGKLARLRKQLTLSQDEVERNTGIESSRIKELEAGVSAPTGDEVLILSDYYKCDYKFFLSTDVGSPVEKTETLYRKFGEHFSKADRWAVQELLFLAETEVYLEEKLGLARHEEFDFSKKGTFYKGHARQCATELRKHLGYGSNEIPSDIFSDFRRIGIKVFRRHLENSTISGLCLRHPVIGPCVLVNYSEDVYRQRFTVAHEAAHAILDREEDVVVTFSRYSKSELVEVRANTFASHYLVPRNTISKMNITGRSIASLVELANSLKVNPKTLAIALGEDGLLSKDGSRDLESRRIPMSMKTDPELPDSMPSKSRARKKRFLELGLSSYYVRVCFDAYHSSHISAARLAESLLLDSESSLREMASLYGQELRYAG